jgi:hypothetical protein
MKEINYQTASQTDLRNHFDVAIRDVYTKLKDSPISRQGRINELIGTYMGICLGRGLDYDFEQIGFWKDTFLY